MIFAAADGATVSRGAASCARQGYRPTWILTGQQVLSEQHGNDPNFEGAIGVDTQAPWFLDNTPARKEFREVMARYAPNVALTTSHMVGWISTRLFELAARQAPQPLTRDGLLAALASIGGDPLADLTVPYRFTPGRPASPTTCYWLESPKSGRWTSPDGGERHCFDYRPA
jgi:ABC-type branched-subunit amino acid transport system substrate-binding protein